MRKIAFLLYLTFLIVGLLSSNTSAWIEEGDKAPSFQMYHYLDKEFDLDTLIGEKIIVLVAGSIT